MANSLWGKPLFWKALFWVAPSLLLAGCITASNTEVKPELSSHSEEQVERLTLTHGQSRLEVTPQIGGRGLFWALENQPNLLLVGDAVARYPFPEITLDSKYWGYLGNIVWLSPQSQWWKQQTLYADKSADGNAWPPDPYVVLGENTVTQMTPSEIIMSGAESPISGVKIVKRWAIEPAVPGAIRLEASLENIRSETVKWGAWFNSRLRLSGQLYVPVMADDDVTFMAFPGHQFMPNYTIVDGVLVMDTAAINGITKGKFKIQPSKGWMAVHQGEQLWVFRFKPLPREAIHSEQGQVEWFINADPQKPQYNLLEMELHGAYKSIAPQGVLKCAMVWQLHALPKNASQTQTLNAIHAALKTPLQWQ